MGARMHGLTHVMASSLPLWHQPHKGWLLGTLACWLLGTLGKRMLCGRHRLGRSAGL